MNEGLEVNVAILRASTNSMSQNCHFSETRKISFSSFRLVTQVEIFQSSKVQVC